MVALGHEVRLIAPQHVRPFVKWQKNDAADAKAIVIVARQSEMRSVVPKTAVQQAKAVLFRSRERMVHQRTEQSQPAKIRIFPSTLPGSFVRFPCNCVPSFQSIQKEG